jgi:hypothetical protein
MKWLKKIILKFVFFYHRIFNTNDVYITCQGNNDGIGAQIHSLFSILLFSRLFNVVYIHSPFKDVQHLEEKADEICQFNLLFNHQIEQENVGHNFNKCRLVSINTPIFYFPSSNSIYVARNCHQVTDLFVDEYMNLPTVINLRSKFLENRDVGKFNVNLHVRRGDVEELGLNSNRYTSLSVIKNILTNLCLTLDNNQIKYEIQLFSQGDISDFKLLKQFPINYQLNKSEIFTFKQLINSEILITAKSSFSYTAALLTSGLVFYEEFWHPPLSHWINFRRESQMSIEKKINKYLHEITQKKSF